MEKSHFFYFRPPKKYILAQALVLVGLVGFFDYLTGYEISFFLFYAAPILLCVWYADRKSTMLTVLVSAIVWWWADWQDGHPYFSSWVQVWETIVRLVFFAFVAIGGSAIKGQRDVLTKRLADLRKMRELEREIVNAGEREQQRIGQDLHDGLCQFLAGLACAAGSLRDDLTERFQPEAAAAAELHELASEAIVRARNIARNIAPVHMDECGLASALEDLAASTSRLHGIDCEFEAGGEILISDRQTAIHLYRTAQEATSNAIRHGRATSIRISAAVADSGILLEVRDNGEGFAGPERPGGMGLRSMRYRAALMGGNFDIVSSPGAGVCVSCRAPLASGAPLEDSPNAD